MGKPTKRKGGAAEKSKPAAPKVSSSFVAEQEKRLRTLRAHLERRTDKVERDLRGEDAPDLTDIEELAITRENEEVLEALSEEGRDQLALVDAALARIASKKYGECERCQKPIARDRLEARPYATICIKCAEA